MKDDATPRNGWNRLDYAKFAPAAKADEYGAMFFYLCDMLRKFCARIRTIDLSFHMYSVNAQELNEYIGDMMFDRIEVRELPLLKAHVAEYLSQISNICDWSYLGPHQCLRVFSPMLKPKSANPHATLLMLFLNAAVEIDHRLQETDPIVYKASVETAMLRVKEYLPFSEAHIDEVLQANNTTHISLEVLRRVSVMGLSQDWDTHFNDFMEEASIAEHTDLCGLELKNIHTLVERWPFRLGRQATQAEFEFLAFSSRFGYERYVEFTRAS
jgi:hypothetical protein